MYGLASANLGDQALFDVAPIKDVVEKIVGSSYSKVAGGGAGAGAESQTNQAIRYILNKSEGDKFTLEEINALRHVIGLQQPGVVGTISDTNIASVKQALTQAIKNKEVAVAAQIDALRVAAKQPGPELASQQQGLRHLHEANEHYAEGALKYKLASGEMLAKNINDGWFVDIESVLDSIATPGQHHKLASYLDMVTPPNVLMNKVSVETVNEALDIARTGNIKLLNEFLDKSDIDTRMIQRLSPDLDALPKDNFLRQRMLGQMVDSLEQYADDALAVSDPIARRNINRDLLANAWLKKNAELSGYNPATKTVSGIFRPQKLAAAFYDLRPDVQNVLFGKAQAKEMQQVFKDFDVLENISADQWRSYAVSDPIIGPPAKGSAAIQRTVAELQEQLQASDILSRNEVVRSLQKGDIRDPAKMIQELISRPTQIDALKRALPEGTFESALEGPGGIRDQTMQRLLSAAMPDGVTQSAVQSGDFAAPFL